MKIRITKRFVFVAVLLMIVLGGRLLYMCDWTTDRSVSENHRNGCGSERMPSEREIRLRAFAQHLKDTGKCEDDETARAGAEAMEAMHQFLNSSR